MFMRNMIRRLLSDVSKLGPNGGPAKSPPTSACSGDPAHPSNEPPSEDTPGITSGVCKLGPIGVPAKSPPECACSDDPVHPSHEPPSEGTPSFDFTSESSEEKADYWKKVTLKFCLPAILITGLYVFLTYEEAQPPKFIKYDYLGIRTKRFPWGDGQKSLFHNPRVNALPDGYEWAEEKPKEKPKEEEEKAVMEEEMEETEEMDEIEEDEEEEEE